MRFLKTEIYFPIIVGLHLLLWAVDLALFEGSLALVDGESSVHRVVGEVMSSWVVTVFGFNLLMATRARWVERVFGGLDKMYLIHRRSGAIALVLLLLHFGIVPRSPEFTIGKPMGFAAMVLILLGIMFAAAPLMKRKLPYHKWLGGHRLMGPFYVIGVAHAAFVPTLISQLPLVRVYVFGMALLGVASWVYRALLFNRLRPPTRYTVTKVRRFGKGAVEIVLSAESEPMAYRAGQFACFSFDEHAPAESHPFTIASAPTDSALRIVVKASGDFTNALVAGVAVGDKVRVEGPYGHLTQDHFESDEQVWIAGGIGITPFLALAKELAQDQTGPKAKLIWSVRNPAEAFFDPELKRLAEAAPNLEYELWNSGEQGFLSVQGAGGSEVFRGKDVVICGPLALRDAVTQQMKKAGAAPREIHSEEFAFR